MLSLFSSLFSGSVRVNTFETGHGKRSNSQPYVDDSMLDLTVTDLSGSSRTFNQPISIPSFKFGSSGLEAVVFIKNLNAAISGRNLFFIKDGNLGLRIAFDTSARNEIEVWARDAIAKCWRDNWLPDIDLRGFSIELMLTPVLRGQTISYSNMTMNTNVNLEIPGHVIEHYLEREAARRIKSGFTPVFDNADVKQVIENAFNDILNNPLLNVHYLVSLTSSGNSIVITYR